MGYYKPFGPEIQRGQRFGDNPGWGPNPAGGHNGDDYLCKVGTPVSAAGDGVVVFAGRFDSTYADNWGWNLNFGGQMVVLNLDGADGPYVEYGHNSELRVSAGDRVSAGQVIALSGEDDGGTHVITGPHLHVGCLPPNFELNTPTYGRVNPDIYLTDYPDQAAGTIATQSATITPQEAGFLMALTDADQDEVLAHERNNSDKLDVLIQRTATLEELVANVRKLVYGMGSLPAATLNQTFTLPDGTTTNLAGILTAIHATPGVAATADPTAIAAAVLFDIQTQWKK